MSDDTRNNLLSATGDACCVCGSVEASQWRVAKDNLLGGEVTYTTVLCTRCGTARLQPRPPADEMGRYYTAATYARAEDDADPELARRLDLFFSHQADRACAAVTPGGERRLLDVGCGDGRFLAAMQSRGWTVDGIETDGVAAGLARRRTGATIRETPLESTEYPPALFDMVSLLHVLEHVPDPRATIEAAYRLLRPGGTLLLALPNIDCAEAALFGANWYPLDLPRHYWGFTPRTLMRLAEECGFRRSRLRYLPFFFAPQSVRYVVRALRGSTAPTAQALQPASATPAAPSKRKTQGFLALLGLSERLGKSLPGEVMELTAIRPKASRAETPA